MAPVIHCSAGYISLFSGTPFISKKDIHLTKCNASGKYMRLTSYYRGLPLPQLSLGLFQSKHISKSGIVAAIGTEATVEESSPAVSADNADEVSESPPKSVETSETISRNKRLRPVRKSEMPPLKDEELVPGASFTGKVRSIQPFGAFVDFGAFTDGLVHVSQISDGYVKDVGAVVSIGQEVKVRVLEANKESGRISLTMRESDDTSKPQQRKEAFESSDKPRPARKNDARPNQKRGEPQKTTTLVKGQVLDGTVKKLMRSGAFVSFPDGEEGFLPTSEESEGFGNIMGNSSLAAGQEVNVRVLRISRGKVTLTMKKEEDVEGLNKQLNQGVVHVATNPFELAFRQNKDIAAFLEKERSKKAISDQIEVSSASGILLRDETPSVLQEEASVDTISTEPVSNLEELVSSSAQDADTVLEILQEDKDSSIAVVESSSDSALDELPLSDEVKDSSPPIENVEDQVNGSESPTPEESESSAGVSTTSLAKDENVVEVKDVIAVVENENIPNPESLLIDEVSISNGVKETDVATMDEQETSSESSSTEKIESSSNALTGEEIAKEEETPQLVETETVSSDSMVPETSNGQNGNPDRGGAIKVNAATISPALVKKLREESGAGMMDCKKALVETSGDLVKAQEYLRKKGLASADKKASRATAEGRVGSYIHDNRIGVLIEVNCETDFVARGEIFKELVDDLAMQVAACPQVRYLATEDVPEEIVKKEREIEMQKEDLLGKPEQIRSKIVDGRIRKRLEEFALLEQPYIKNDKVVVKDLVKQTIATIGENIKVKRFVRFNLGEGLKKKSQDFAAEVAAQTAARAPPAAAKDQSAESKETVEKAATVKVSAALVKQLREETGAGMMDCKKALAETGGDLEKAQEYLRKKGLSSADKKSSRLAAEGRISSYIHDSRIGVLIEVNSETDFVARNERFKELVDDLAMQVAACPQVEFVSVDEIAESIVSKEKEIEMEREDLKSKPEHIREKIVEGRISKRLGELALLEQPFIKDDSIMVKDLVKNTVAALGENIKVRRFVRFTLGESTD